MSTCLQDSRSYLFKIAIRLTNGDNIDAESRRSGCADRGHPNVTFRAQSLVIAIDPLEKNDNAQDQPETQNSLNEFFGKPEHHRFI